LLFLTIDKSIEQNKKKFNLKYLLFFLNLYKFNFFLFYIDYNSSLLFKKNEIDPMSVESDPLFPEYFSI
jgi:hypothetical protein